MAEEINPDLLQARIEAMKTKAELQMRLAEIKIRGYIKDWDDFVLLYMIMTGQVQMPKGALYEGDDNMTGETLQGRGLFNPLRKIKIVNKQNLKQFAQHFPMLFKPGENLDRAIQRLTDYLDEPDAKGADQWMKLIGPGGSNVHETL